MTKKQEIQLFNDRRIRTIWDDKEEKWYFSVVDVIEPFKIWMASVASERLDEMQDPELTDEWSRCGVTTQQYASLTDIVTMAWSGKSTRSYKAHKGLTKQNLRDNMTNVELALNTLAEAATTELSKEINPTTYRENVTVARKGGGVAKVAREQLEQQLGRSVISDSNSSTLRISRDSPDEQ